MQMGLCVIAKKNILLKQVFVLLFFLPVYKSPQYETLGFNLIKERLLQMGYPNTLQEFVYDASFPIRYVCPMFVFMLTCKKRLLPSFMIHDIFLLICFSFQWFMV